MFINRYHNASLLLINWRWQVVCKMNTLKSLAILSLVLVAAAGRKEKKRSEQLVPCFRLSSR